jgi:hypothetical protein
MDADSDFAAGCFRQTKPRPGQNSASSKSINTIPEPTSTMRDIVTLRAGFSTSCGSAAAFRFCRFKSGWNDTYVCSDHNLGRAL